MQQPTRDQPLNYLIASSYIATTFVLSLASVFLMRRSDSSHSETAHPPSTSITTMARSWSQLSALFESWTGAGRDGKACTKEELEEFKRSMHCMIAERQKAHEQELHLVTQRNAVLERQQSDAAQVQIFDQEQLQNLSKEICNMKGENTDLRRELNVAKDASIMLTRQLELTQHELDLCTAKADTERALLAEKAENDRKALKGTFLWERRSLEVKIEELTARNTELREERHIFAKQAEDVKAKYKERQQQWKDERMRMLRCLDAQTKTNTAHLQEISRQLAPGGSLRQSLDLSLGCGSDLGMPQTPQSGASMRRHSLAVPGLPRMQSCSHGGTSMCSSPHFSAASAHFQAVQFEAPRMDSPRRHSIAGRVHDIIPQPSADLEAVISGPPLDGCDARGDRDYANENQGQRVARQKVAKARSPDVLVPPNVQINRA
eukprot:jgi/Ulvmu1/558/UM001_0566.1